MTTAVKARTARKPHLCEKCRQKTIAPGHRYLRHVRFPDDINTSGKPWVITECIACLAERDGHAPLLDADACSTYCHGTTPCARPHRHDGDHECRQCLADRVPATTTA